MIKTEMRDQFDPKSQIIIDLVDRMQTAIPDDAKTADVYSAINLMLAQSLMGQSEENIKGFCDTMHKGILLTQKAWKKTNN